MRKTRLPPLTDAEGEVRELTAADFKQSKPAQEALPASLHATLGIGKRGKQKSPTKVALSVRLHPDVVNAFRATGDGWQTRMDVALQDWLQTHNPSDIVLRPS